MKYLVVGLGNIGSDYENTRHNIGFKILDFLAKESSISFKEDRYGEIAHYSFKARNIILLKPNTYMNLSGKAVKYWLEKEKIPLDRLLIITDDIALPFGKLRLKHKGSNGGHNGLKNIEAILNTAQYPRLRFGVGSDFNKGKQVDYVLGEWSAEEQPLLMERYERCMALIQSFATIGMDRTMNSFNNT